MAVIFMSDGAGGIGINAPIPSTGIFNGAQAGTSGNTIDTVVKEHGYGSISLDSTATGGSAYIAAGTIGGNPILADAGRRTSVRLRFSALPATNNTGIMRVYTSASTSQVAEIRLDTSGNLRLYAGASGTTLLATGTTVLSTLTWYRIALCYTITSASVSEWRVYLDGNLELTASNPASQVTASSVWRVGWTGTSVGTSVKMWAQDFYVDDSTALTDPGDIRVTCKMPAGLGATNNFDTAVGTGTNRWDRVNERPANANNRYTQAATTQQSEQYTVEAASVGDDDLTSATILALGPWVYYSLATAAGSALSSMIANGSFLTLTTTSGSGAYQQHMRIVNTATFPSGNNAIGLRSTGTTVDTHLAECGVFIAYTLPAGSSGGPVFTRSRQSRNTTIRM